ncbi:MAG: PorV/PorQ family protein, partial [Chlorobi bacterium]|nr:PorV/PorQ family protein [Chlorobiota bacterium]
TNYGSFEYADKYGVQNGESFSANDLAMAVTYSNELDTNLYYGVTAKFIYVNIEEQSAVAAAMDVGLYYAIPDKRTNIGFSILNVGTELSSINGVSESLPLDIRFGLNHRLRGLPLLINVSLHHLADETDSFTDKLTSFSIGGEFYFGKYIRARAGFDNQTRRQTSPDTEKGLSGITAGFGIDTDMLQFDYGFSQVGTSAALHRFSIRFDID